MDIDQEPTHESNDDALDAGVPKKNPPDVLAKLDALHNKGNSFSFFDAPNFWGAECPKASGF